MKEKELAPNFKIPSSNNEEFELKKNRNNFLIIYFYPRDNTPGCTNEAKDFSKLYKEFKKLNCEIFGISKDSIESHKKFMGIKRTTVLINPKSKIIKIWNNVKVKDHAKEVLNCLKEAI